ncbi:MAG: hypothetical protein PCFJNLEI_03221 [Verrucomicrobiae bacterium]|nr:hypothetical protein [Verrucomicrobiae bacterium]
MTRNGKIARLPFAVRETLNRCLRDGQPGTELVAWLNALPEMHARPPISPQNLSEWKQGGYQDWLRQQEATDLARVLAERAAVVGEAAGTASVGDRLAPLLAVELAQQIQSVLEQTTDPEERWTKLGEALQHLAGLRRADHSAGWLRLEQERWNCQQAEREDSQAERQRLAPLLGATTRETLRSLGVAWPAGPAANPTESKCIRPDQTSGEGGGGNGEG